MEKLTDIDAYYMICETEREDTRSFKIGNRTYTAKRYLTAAETRDFILRAVESIIHAVTDEDKLAWVDYFVRAITIQFYTGMDVGSLVKHDSLNDVVQLLYKTPLYAILVGSPLRPVYFEGKAYTDPVVDIEQYYALITAIQDCLPKFIAFNLFNNQTVKADAEPEKSSLDEMSGATKGTRMGLKRFIDKLKNWQWWRMES